MDFHDRIADGRTRILRGTRHWFEIDTRSLAALRVALGLIVIFDLALRARYLGAFYSDVGVLPRSAFHSQSHPLQLSLHTLSGDAWFQGALFLVAGVFAVALAIGCRTSFATVATWLLLVSLHNRNGLVLNGGDVLLRMLLFWAIFLPLADRWSVDAHRVDQQRTRVAGIAAAALLLQVVVMYTTNAALKLSGDIWLRGDGLEYVFSLGQFTVLLGDIIASYTAVLEALDYLWLVMIACSFLLIVLPGTWRIGFALLFAAMHVGMALTMRLGLFPLISIAALLPFLPGAFWDTVAPHLSRYGPVTAVGRLPAGLDVVLPEITVSGAPSEVQRMTRPLLTVVLLVFLVLIVLWNMQFLGYSQAVGHDVVTEEAESVITVTRTDQYWDMFAPDPLAVDGWIVAPGRFENGSRVDAFHGRDVRWRRPPDVSSTYPTARWRKYLVRLWRYDTPNREHFAEYLCRRWNGQHETPLKAVTVYYMEQPTQIGNESESISRVRLADTSC